MGLARREGREAEGALVIRVVLLNGAPSSGKTTLVRALREVLDPPHFYLSLDDFRRGYLEKDWDSERGPWWQSQERNLFRLLLKGYLLSLRAMADAGHHVIAEAVILPSSRYLYLDAFAGQDVFLVGVRCPLAVAQQRERERGDRVRGVPIELDVPEFDLVHSHGAYDIEVDTSVRPVHECVDLIRRALASPTPSPSAFERMPAA